MRIIELFGGIGACSKALLNLGASVEILDYVEIDKYAVKSYSALHHTFEPQDITIWNKHFENVDLIMHGSPCQDFSVAGKQAGGDKGSGTRSSLLYETLRIVEDIKPKYVVWENVKNLLSEKHKHNLDNYIEEMNRVGYRSYYEVLNSKDYGIPQKRERIFVVSIRNDIDKEFIFPPKKELNIVLKDLLEEKVDEKYYLSEKMVNYILDMKDKQLGTKWEGRADNDILNADIAHTISVRGAGGSQRAGVSNFIVEGIDGEIKVKDLKNVYLRNLGSKENSQIRIRKLTPKECWRLMGFSDEDFEKVRPINSDSQLYKQAGNSIVVNVLEEIFINLFP